MTVDEERAFLERAWKAQRKIDEISKVLKSDGTLGLEALEEKRKELWGEQARARIEIYDHLKAASLSPRQMDVMMRHCVKCQSWTKISIDLKKQRRYLIRCHEQAIERLVSQMK